MFLCIALCYRRQKYEMFYPILLSVQTLLPGITQYYQCYRSDKIDTCLSRIAMCSTLCCRYHKKYTLQTVLPCVTDLFYPELPCVADITMNIQPHLFCAKDLFYPVLQTGLKKCLNVLPNNTKCVTHWPFVVLSSVLCYKPHNNLNSITLGYRPHTVSPSIGFSFRPDNVLQNV